MFLFEGTVRDNSAKGLPNATDEEIINVAQLAGLHDLIIDFPDGYATDIGEAGSHLSGGMRQRLSVARAAWRPARIAAGRALLESRPGRRAGTAGQA
ncbi:MAG: hypothetical protein CL569_09065 [Alphaproteobacteria bacterium]|nr:hypothetical protein [Alphaproteobacteria bacterium]